MVLLSTKLRHAIRLTNIPQYELARRVGVHPSQLSAWVCGIYSPPGGDDRVLALGRILGIKQDECFERDDRLDGRIGAGKRTQPPNCAFETLAAAERGSRMAAPPISGPGKNHDDAEGARTTAQSTLPPPAGTAQHDRQACALASTDDRESGAKLESTSTVAELAIQDLAQSEADLLEHLVRVGYETNSLREALHVALEILHCTNVRLEQLKRALNRLRDEYRALRERLSHESESETA
jgi:transcriptional regulator with XRE-family HTH domain